MRINGKFAVLNPSIRTRRDTRTEYDEVLAVAMLCGEPMPITCSSCIGSQYVASIIGRPYCNQCDGKGYDYIGDKTLWALVKRYHGEGATIDR